MVRDQASSAPDATNVAESAHWVRRANMPDLEDYAEKVDYITKCQADDPRMN